MRKISTAEVEELAQSADVDTRTAIRFLAGLPVRPRIEARLEHALSLIKKNRLTRDGR